MIRSSWRRVRTLAGLVDRHHLYDHDFSKTRPWRSLLRQAHGPRPLGAAATAFLDPGRRSNSDVSRGCAGALRGKSRSTERNSVAPCRMQVRLAREKDST